MSWIWFWTAVVVLTLGPTWGRAAPATACEGWNTEGFFRTAAPERVQACLAAGADPNARDVGTGEDQYGNKYDWTPLHLAAGSTDQSGRDYHPARGGGRPHGADRGRGDAAALGGRVRQSGRDYRPAGRGGQPHVASNGRR